MRKTTLALMAAGLLAVSALPAAAASGQKSEQGINKSQAGSVDLSARRYYRGYRGGYRGYRYGYARPYYRPYYGYGGGPYYGGGYGYYRPAPFPFFPFF